ncbi:nuclear transport factor 2 family protein [Sphingomonas sp. SRS2]|uniref:nuclear transport factor 2 family protein n=1 Tax=Sphingomonas sp. SRS2 TaxID=133190 RepID=UPI0006184079|nr:nuclear transport factor 2 family protein [Sphingomonas sp. SRS2]KKC26064.1 hypothetical protein WP12_10655 [Sphingomonas sp. SRS2]
MQIEIAAVSAVVQTYLQALFNGDAAGIASAFHPDSHLYSVGAEGALGDLPRADWLKLIEQRPSAQSRGLERNDRVVSLDFSGPATACVKVECTIPPAAFVDHLLLLKLADGWRIVAKSFHSTSLA